MYVAEDKGLYRREGLAVTLIERDLKGPKLVDLLESGAIDIAVVSSGDFLRAINAGARVKALAAVYQISPIALASLGDNQIASPQDLWGKKIGIAVVTEESKLPYYALLEGAKMPTSAVTFTEVGFNQIDALLDGTVDAVSIYRTNELYELDKKGVPYTLLLPERFGVDLYGDIIVVNDAYLEKHTKEVGGFLRATFKGWKYAEQNPDEAVRAILKMDNPKYHDAERERYILNNALMLVRQYPKQTLGQMLPLQWTYMYSLFKQHGLVSDIVIDNFFPDFKTFEKLGFPEF